MSDRLECWKRLRHSLQFVPFEKSLEMVAQHWVTAPFSPYYLDPAAPKTWPDPWTLITDNCYCDVAKALGMLYTIQLSVHHSHDLRVKIYQQPATRHQYNLVWIDSGKYVLNLEHNEVLNKKSITKDLVKIAEYTTSDLEHS